MVSKEEGIKLFGTTISLHGRPAVRSEDQKRSADQTVEKRPDKIIPCPRCRSMETKFCYFNNYNVNQPRHFCKGCQRYWTAGGALRNVPVGAGRQKNKPHPHGGESGGGFSVDHGGFYDGSAGVMHQLELDGALVEEWHVAAHGGFQHVFPVKRRRSS